jgi:hypothetical protein
MTYVLIATVELIHIQPEVRVGAQLYALSVCVQPVSIEGLAQGGEGAAQGSPPVALVQLRPQQVDQCIAPVAFSGDGNVGQEGDGFARVHRDRHAVALDARRAEQIQAQPGHLLPPSGQV